MGKKSRKNRTPAKPSSKSNDNSQPKTPPKGRENAFQFSPGRSKWTGPERWTVEEMKEFLTNGYDIKNKKEALSHWKSLSREEQKQIVQLDEDRVVTAFNTMWKGKIEIYACTDEGLVREVQTKFIEAMSNNNGKFLFPAQESYQEKAFLSFSILSVLEDNLLHSHAKQDILRKVWMVGLFFVWRLTTWPVSISAFLAFFTFYKHEQTEPVKDLYCRAVTLMFIHDSDPESVEWKAHSYLTGLLLIYLAIGVSWYVFVGLIVALPYMFGVILPFFVVNDRESFGKIRKFALYAEKSLLLYFAWFSWSALACVGGIFFIDLFSTTFSIGLVLVSVALRYISEKLADYIPLDVRLRWRTWMSNPRHQLLYTGIVLLVGVIIVYLTWAWEGIGGSIFRIVLLMVSLQVIPAHMLSVAIQLGVLLMMLPIAIAQYVAIRTKKFFRKMSVRFPLLEGFANQVSNACTFLIRFVKEKSSNIFPPQNDHRDHNYPSSDE